MARKPAESDKRQSQPRKPRVTKLTLRDLNDGHKDVKGGRNPTEPPTSKQYPCLSATC